MNEKHTLNLQFFLFFGVKIPPLWLILLSVLFLPACGASPVEPRLPTATLRISETPPILDGFLGTNTPVPYTRVPESLTPSPAPIGAQILTNGGFESGVGGWDRSYGSLSHTRSDYHTGPGAGRLTASDPSGFSEYRGNIGQCIDLTEYLDQWPMIDGDMYMTLEAYLRPGEDIYRTTLNGIFIDDTRCGTGHVGSFDIPALEGAYDWILLVGDAVIPDSARSIHVFISTSGANDTAEVLIDDVRAYPGDPRIH
jgi:hypothetical protein